MAEARQVFLLVMRILRIAYAYRGLRTWRTLRRNSGNALNPPIDPFRLLYRHGVVPLRLVSPAVLRMIIFMLLLGRLGLLPGVRYEGGFHWRGV